MRPLTQYYIGERESWGRGGETARTSNMLAVYEARHRRDLAPVRRTPIGPIRLAEDVSCVSREGEGEGERANRMAESDVRNVIYG